MKKIPGVKDGWKCKKCGLELWFGNIPTWTEYQDIVDMHRPVSMKELMGPPGVIRKGGSKSGRSHGQPKKKGMKFYYFDSKPKK
jgi:hypothetical protein